MTDLKELDESVSSHTKGIENLKPRLLKSKAEQILFVLKSEIQISKLLLEAATEFLQIYTTNMEQLKAKLPTVEGPFVKSQFDTAEIRLLTLTAHSDLAVASSKNTVHQVGFLKKKNANAKRLEKYLATLIPPKN